MGSDRAVKKIAWAVFALALLLRLGYVLSTHTEIHRIEVDAIEYDSMARNIAAGHGMAVRGGELTTYRPPLWPYLLAAIYKVFGHSHLAARVVLAFLGAAIPPLVVLAMRRWLGTRQLAALGVLVACWPQLVIATGQLMTETLFTLLLAGVVFLALEWWARPRWWRAVALGAVLGLAGLARGNALMFAPLLALWMLIPFRRTSVLHVGLTAAAAALVLFPWVVRNYRVNHSLVLVSCNSGYVFSLNWWSDPPTLYHGERAEAYIREAGPAVSSERVFDIVSGDNQFSAEFVRGRIGRLFPEVACPATEVGMDSLFMAKSMEFVRANPAALMVKMVKDFVRFWYFFDSWSRFMVSWASALPWIMIGILAALRSRRREVWLMFLLIATSLVNAVIFHPAVRFRLPFEVFLLVFAVTGFTWLWRRARVKWLVGAAVPVLLVINLGLGMHQEDLRNTIRGAATRVGLPVWPWMIPPSGGPPTGWSP